MEDPHEPHSAAVHPLTGLGAWACRRRPHSPTTPGARGLGFPPQRANVPSMATCRRLSLTPSELSPANQRPLGATESEAALVMEVEQLESIHPSSASAHSSVISVARRSHVFFVTSIPSIDHRSSSVQKVLFYSSWRYTYYHPALLATLKLASLPAEKPSETCRNVGNSPNSSRILFCLSKPHPSLSDSPST